MSAAGGAMALAGDAPSHGTAGGAAPEIGTGEFAVIQAIMQREARIALSPAKTTLVQSRLARRLRKHGLATFRDYCTLVEADAEERAAMVVALTTNHTHFFREAHHFDHLRETLLPRLKAKAQRREPVRIWSAACSSGEEVYTLAMCLLGTDAQSAGWLRNADVRLLATDISPPVVAAAVRGVYPDAAGAAVPEPYRKAWMRRQGDQWAIADEAKALVTARVLNLFGPWPMRQHYDAIFCRNVMIYFDDDAKAELEARLVDQLAPGGFLYIGHSERMIGSAATRMQSCGHTIYVKKDG